MLTNIIFYFRWWAHKQCEWFALVKMKHKKNVGGCWHLSCVSVSSKVKNHAWEEKKVKDSTGDHYDDINIDTEVLARLSNMISQYSQQINPEFDDLILKMKFDLNHAQEQTNINIISCNALIDKLNIVANKIKLKQKGENLLKSFVEKKIKVHHTELINHKRALIVFARMLKILEDYHYGHNEWQLLIQQDGDVTP